MSKLAHSNQETMDQIEAQAIADEEAGKPQDPPERGGHAMTDTDALIESVKAAVFAAFGSEFDEPTRLHDDEARAAAVAVLKEIEVDYIHNGGLLPFTEYFSLKLAEIEDTP